MGVFLFLSIGLTEKRGKEGKVVKGGKGELEASCIRRVPSLQKKKRGSKGEKEYLP